MHNLISRSIRFSPDVPAAGGAGGAAAAPPTPAAGAAGGETIGGVPVDRSMQKPRLDLDAEVVQDGKTYKVRDLIDAHKRAATLESTKTEMETALKSLYGKGPAIETPEAFEEASKHLRYARKLGGYSDAEIDAELAQLKEKSGFGAAGGGEVDEDAIGKHPVVLQNQKLNESILRRFADTSINAALTNTSELKKFVDTVAKVNGAEDAKAISDSILVELRRELAPLVKARMQAAGGSLDDVGWIDEEMPKAAKKVIDRMRPYMRMVEQVGKGESGPDFLAGMPEKPAERPKPTDGPRHVTEKNLAAWVEDRLMRSMQSAMAGATG